MIGKSWVITDYLARVEEAVRDNLQGARIIALFEWDVSEYPERDYWERVYLVAWEREDQCGTHRVNIDSQGRSACFSGVYDMERAAALDDLFRRAGR